MERPVPRKKAPVIDSKRVGVAQFLFNPPEGENLEQSMEQKNKAGRPHESAQKNPLNSAAQHPNEVPPEVQYGYEQHIQQERAKHAEELAKEQAQRQQMQQQILEERELMNQQLEQAQLNFISQNQQIGGQLGPQLPQPIQIIPNDDASAMQEDGPEQDSEDF